MFSRPMLALSIATAFTVEPESNNVAPDSVPEDDPSSDVRSEISVQDEVETRCFMNDFKKFIRDLFGSP